MSNLKYKTRTMSNPQGKPKLYFCAHPEEFDQLFESISNELQNLIGLTCFKQKEYKDFC